MHYTIKKSTEAATTLATLKSVGGKNDVSKLIIFLKLLIFLTSKVCYKFDIVLNWPQKKGWWWFRGHDNRFSGQRSSKL